MKRNLLLVIVVMIIGFTILLAVLGYRLINLRSVPNDFPSQYISNNALISTGTNESIVESYVPNKSVKIVNEQVLNEILDRLQIYTTGIRNPELNHIQEVSKLYVSLVPDEQPKLPTKDVDETILSSANYVVINDVLVILIHVDPEYETADYEAVFNNKLISLLVMLSATSPTRNTNAGLEERSKFIDDILQEYIYKDNGYTIPFEVKSV